MLKELRLQLTLISSTITGLILFIICFIALQISESQFNSSNQIAFENQLQTISYQLQTQRNIKSSWLAQLEADNRLIISIEDNGHPFFFKGSWSPPTPRHDLLQNAYLQALEIHGFDKDAPTTSSLSIDKIFFKIQGNANEYYRVGIARIPSTMGNYTLTLLQDLSNEKANIIETRVLFIMISFTGIVLLSIFSYWFAGRAIIPIEANQRKQVQFIAAASHELKTPLAVIRSSNSVIQSQNHEAVQLFTSQIERECARLTRLINDLLLLATADAHTWSIHKELVDLDTLLIDLLDTFLPIAAKKQQQLSLHLPDEMLPPIPCDQERIVQIITILIDNALYYVPVGGHITMELSKTPGASIIKIIDDGPGISKEHAPHIFDRFYRVDGARKDKNHYGLGLSIAKEIIHLHNGSLTLSPTPGGGCTFKIELPYLSKK